MVFEVSAFLPANTSDFWLTRFVILRVLGVVYFFAFLSLVRQVIPLLGGNGLTPARQYLDGIRPYFRNKLHAFWKLPTVFWLGASDRFLLLLGFLGLALSVVVIVGFANVIILFLLWFIYLSFVHVGQIWYGYGWETELLETGFIAMFLVPLLNPGPFPDFAAPLPAIWLMLWLAFRVHFGAGLIKLRADKCWRDLTCLYYHFETQPLPNPLSRHFHFLPKSVLRFGVLWTHFAQLIAPLMLVVPGITRVIGGVVLLMFQVILIISGNLSFLNIISVTAIIAAFNDSFLSQLLPQFIVNKASEAAATATYNPHYAAWAFFAIAVPLSIPAVKNLFSRHQAMNASFNQFHLMNTYGAFGAVGRKRYELVVKGTRDGVITPATQWREYEFLAKPTDIKRHLPVIAPYQPRIDWQVWFAAMQTPRDNPWMLHFIWKLLHNDKAAVGLIRRNPFPEKPPKHIAVDIYEYRFAPPGSGKVWRRKKLAAWLLPLSKESLSEFIELQGWK